MFSKPYLFWALKILSGPDICMAPPKVPTLDLWSRRNKRSSTGTLFSSGHTQTMWGCRQFTARHPTRGSRQGAFANWQVQAEMSNSFGAIAFRSFISFSARLLAWTVGLTLSRKRTILPFIPFLEIKGKAVEHFAHTSRSSFSTNFTCPFTENSVSQALKKHRAISLKVGKALWGRSCGAPPNCSILSSAMSQRVKYVLQCCCAVWLRKNEAQNCRKQFTVSREGGTREERGHCDVTTAGNSNSLRKLKIFRGLKEIEERNFKMSNLGFGLLM